jgi:hypothetical protein
MEAAEFRKEVISRITNPYQGGAAAAARRVLPEPESESDTFLKSFGQLVGSAKEVKVSAEIKEALVNHNIDARVARFVAEWQGGSTIQRMTFKLAQEANPGQVLFFGAPPAGDYMRECMWEALREFACVHLAVKFSRSTGGAYEMLLTKLKDLTREGKSAEMASMGFMAKTMTTQDTILKKISGGDSSAASVGGGSQSPNRRNAKRPREPAAAAAARHRAPSQHPCWRCGKPGHEKAECPNAPLSLDEQAKVKKDFFTNIKK